MRKLALFITGMLCMALLVTSVTYISSREVCEEMTVKDPKTGEERLETVCYAVDTKEEIAPDVLISEKELFEKVKAAYLLVHELNATVANLSLNGDVSIINDRVDSLNYTLIKVKERGLVAESAINSLNVTLIGNLLLIDSLNASLQSLNVSSSSYNDSTLLATVASLNATVNSQALLVAEQNATISALKSEGEHVKSEICRLTKDGADWC